MPLLNDDPIIKEYRRQQLFGTLGRIGQGLLSANAQGAGLLPGLAYGLNQAGAGAGGMDMMEMLRLRREMEADKDRKARAASYSQLVGGLDPQSGIDWQTGRRSGGVAPQYAMAEGGGPTPQAAGLLSEAAPNPLLEGVTPQQMGLLRSVGPEAGMGLLAKQAFAKPPEQYETVQDPYGRGGVGQRSTTTGQISGYQAPEKPDRSLVEIADPLSPTGTKWVRREEAIGQPGKPPSSLMRITGYDAEGRPLMEIGGRGGLQKKTTGDIEAKLLSAREGLARVRGIKAKFKPEYQEVGTRIGHALTGVKARFGGRVSVEDRATYTRFADYQRDATSNINLYIKEITGAQMGEAEADRLKLAVPDPGAGIFSGDDPIKFASKLDSVERDLEKAAVRYEYYLALGITDAEQISQLSPLDSMPIAVNPETGERIVRLGEEWVPMR